METEKNVVRKRKSSAQARGNVRRVQLVVAGKKLLTETSIDVLSLADVAKEAEIPLGSVYHFFPKINNLLAEIARQFGEDILEVVFQPIELLPDDNWPILIRRCVDRAVTLYKENAAYQQLLISGKTPAEIKLSDRENDAVIGKQVIRLIDKHFVMNDFKNREQVFFHLVEIIDLMLMLSVNKHGEITSVMAEEAKRAAISYLKCYLPEYLPSRHLEEN